MMTANEMRQGCACLLAVPALWTSDLAAQTATPSPTAVPPPTVAPAATSPVERAELAFREGKRLKAEGRLEEGCAKFQESQIAAPGSGTLLNLADCQERVGRTATAWATFRAAAALSRAKGKAARAEEAQARASALEPRLSRLRVVVPSNAELDGLVIFRNDIQMSEPEIDKGVPVDPGSVIVVAEAPGHLSWATTVTIPARPGVTEMTIPRLPSRQRTTPPGGPLGLPGTITTDSTVQLVVGSVLTGLGALALATGTGLGVRALSKNAESHDSGHCDDASNLCTAAGLDLRNTALTSAHASTGLLIAGGAALVGGVAMLLTLPSSNQEQVGVFVNVAPTRGGGALSVGGRF